MVSFHPNTLLLLVATSLLLLQSSSAGSAGDGKRELRKNNQPLQPKQQQKKPVSLPGPLQHHTRGGYTSSARSPLTRLFTSTLAPPPPPLMSQQQKRWKQQQQHRHTTPLAPPPPVEFACQRIGTIDGDLVLPSHGQQQHYVQELKRQVSKTSEAVAQDQQPQKEASLSRLDVALFGTYFCNSVAVALPVILMPLVAAEHVAMLPAKAGVSAAAVVATIASISTLGGGFGKCLNGFVCQAMGGKQSSALYLVGVASASVLLSTSPASYAGWILAVMEFFASIQWTACSLILANHYERTPAKFAKGITILSLASTSGTLAAKIGGTALLKLVPSWRNVAQLAGVMALLGAGIVKILVAEQPATTAASRSVATSVPRGQKQSIGHSIKAVLGSPLFWQVGIAHATAMIARTSDRILGAFFHQTTALPRSICGGLTAFVTLGFVHGLCKGSAFHKLQDIPSKTRMLSKAYTLAALSAIAMALCANQGIQRIFFPSQHVLAATVAALTGILSSNISFQFYQIPAIVVTTFFKGNKALALSLFDALGFFSSASVWAITGKIVDGAGQHGWTLAWLMLAGMFGAGGKTMMNVLPSVLRKQQQQLQHQQ